MGTRCRPEVVDPTPKGAAMRSRGRVLELRGGGTRVGLGVVRTQRG